jgi:signal transduction histidine kinase
MSGEASSVSGGPVTSDHSDQLVRALAELREANERLISIGVRMQELADDAQEARRQAEAANLAKDEFLAALSHELRTPLNAILGWTHLLRGADLTDALAGRALEIIERNAKLQSQLIADLLETSRIASGRLRLEVERLDLAPLVETGIESLRPAATAKGLRIDCRIEPGVRSLIADPTRVQQIIWNVLSNAIKFTPQGGRIDITLQQVGATAELSIRDSGEGIEAAFLPHVFDRFRQGHVSAAHGPTGGVGLGLAIVRQLMELHGGCVKAESSGIGAGSAFTLTFPTPFLASGVEQLTSAPSLTGLRLLIVENDRESRDSMVVLMSSHGAKVTVAGAGGDALAAFESRRPDLMIVDIDLPDMDGDELIGKVRALEGKRQGEVPAIAVTAYERPHDSADAGFQMFVSKPVEPGKLVDTVAVLGRRS